MLAVLLASLLAQAPPVTVAAASDLQIALPALVARFEQAAGIRVRVTYGSSGNFSAQIRNGAPFDVFLSADVDYPRQLVATGHADAASLYEYATGRIVLWTRTDSGIDVTRGLAVLRDARVRRLAIANPVHAPYGRAAVAALERAGLFDAAKPKLVLGENISQAAQLVDSGNAQAGIIALSLALGPALRASGTYFEIPSGAHPPIRQAAVVLGASPNRDAAIRFLAYLRSVEAQATLRRSGFAPAR